MAIPNTVPITGPIAPTAVGDTYPSHLAEYGKGGYRTVADTTERDAIPAARREEGMQVYVIAGGGITYQLASDLTTWNPVGSGIDPDDVMLKSVYDTTDSGVVDDSQRLDNQLPAYYLDRTNHTGTQAQATVTNLTSDLAAKIPLTQKGAANGVAPLNASTKIDNSYLDFPVPLNYAGVWNATTNTPALADGVGSASDAYITSVAGTQDLGSGNITFAVGDIVVYDGSVWQKVPTAGVGVSQVTTALGIQTGAVVIDDTTYIDPSTDRNYVTDDEDDALANANTPNAANPFATMADIVGSSVTYALTPDEFANGETIGDNTTRTLTSLGYTNGTAAAAWPLVAANASWVGAIDVTTMTIDWIAIQEALLTVETGQRTYFFSPNGTRRYRVNHTIKLPRINGTGSGTPINIDFGGAKVLNVSGNNLIVFDRFPPDQTTALSSWAGYPLHIRNLVIEGNGVNTNTANICMRVGANIKGSYTNIFTNNCCTPLALYFNLMVRIQDCQFTGFGLYGVATSDASAASNTLGYSWTGATNTNSQSNIVIYNNVRMQPGGAATVVAPFYHKGGYGHFIQFCNVENLGGTTQHLVFYDSAGDSIDQPIWVSGLNWEVTGNVTRSAIRIRTIKGKSIVEYCGGYVNGTYGAFVEGDNRGASSNPSVVIRHCAPTTAAKLRSTVIATNATNARAYQFTFWVDDVTLPEHRDILSASNWVSSGAPVWNGVAENSVTPDRIHVRYKSPYVSLNDYYIAGTDQEVPDVLDFPRVTAGYDDTSPVGVITPTYIGQVFVKTTATKAAWIATGLTSSDWLQIA
jgi:hypothetical protein